MKRVIVAICLIFMAIVGLSLLRTDSDDESPVQTAEEPQQILMTPVDVPDGLEVATFAAGCFWCTEALFQEQDGTQQVTSGYAGGQEVNPTYEQVYTHRTGHRESIQFFYDPMTISYDDLLNLLWQSIDPTDEGGQFVDRGFAYTTAIFYHNDEQKRLAEQSLQELSNSGRFDQPIATKLLPFTTFYPAEEYHQDFYLKSPTNYDRYEKNSGRDQYKDTVWPEL